MNEIFMNGFMTKKENFLSLSAIEKLNETKSSLFNIAHDRSKCCQFFVVCSFYDLITNTVLITLQHVVP